jgi:hypothetical protein
MVQRITMTSSFMVRLSRASRPEEVRCTTTSIVFVGNLGNGDAGPPTGVDVLFLLKLRSSRSHVILLEKNDSEPHMS